MPRWLQSLFEAIRPIALIWLIVLPACAQTITSDMVLTFDCEEQSFNLNSTSLERLLRSADYEIFDGNEALVRNGKTPLLRSSYVAIRPDNSAYILISSKPMKPGRFILSLKSRPPTLHDRDFERRLQKAFDEIPRCSIKDVRYGDNPAETSWAYDQIIALDRRINQ